MEKLYLGKGQFPPKFFDGAAQRILDLQRHDGAIPWFDGGVVDPWNHIEAAMGLSILGHHADAESAYRWLAQTQLADGSWWGELGASVPVDLEDHKFKGDGSEGEPPIRDTNFCAYIATGVWHHFLITGDRGFLAEFWPCVERAIEFVLQLQSEHGEVRWAANDPHRETADDALRTGCASIYKSLECALRIATELGHARPDWVAARSALGQALRHKPHRFDRTWESKERYSMDWYYPVLTGAVQGEAARSRIAGKWDLFVEQGRGCRCVSDEPWVTVAETCELTLALIAMGQPVRAMELFSWVHQYRDDSGAYWMGYQMVEEIHWPQEMPAWTAGAVLLAADALCQATEGARLFVEVLDEDAAQDGERFYRR